MGSCKSNKDTIKYLKGRERRLLSELDTIKTTLKSLGSNMDVVFIDYDREDDNVYINCPCCDELESIHVDEARHHLVLFGITDWMPDRHKNETEVSEMVCHKCKKEFRLYWKYK